VKPVLPLAFAIVLFAAGVTSESHGSDLLRISSDGWYTWQVRGDRQFDIYARIESGRPTEVLVPQLQCGRKAPPDASNLGLIDAAESVAWLGRFISPRSDVTSEVMAAISAHPGGAGTDILKNVVRSDRNRKNREEAVFWLAQTDDDAAFAFLDALLTRAN
jgi:hypothetical protein